jgi:transposase
MILHQNILGVDAAKDWIDICDLASGQVRRIETKPRALAAFAGSLPADALVVFEASGGCERPLMAALEEKNCPYARVNPRHAREFARACGKLAKTDKVDARILAQMGRALELKPTPPVDPARRRLADLIARREDIVAAITAETNRLHQARDRFVHRDIATHVALLKGRRLAIENEIASHKRQSETLNDLDRRLRTAPGVGPAIASVLLAYLPELGSIDRRAIASLAGLAPHACESGHSKGRRQVWGGRSEVRRALYRAAFIASRWDPGFKATRTQMANAGKPLKLILIAIARRLLVALNAIIRDNRDFTVKAA